MCVCVSMQDLPGVLSARDFVGWYNGYPRDSELNIDTASSLAVM